MNALVVTVNLPGAIKEVKIFGKNKEKRVEIHHECTRKTNISEEVVEQWVHGGCPSWQSDFFWKKMNVARRIASYVTQFDEGYGVKAEELN